MNTTKLCALLKKGITFNWPAEHEDEFEETKIILTSPLVVKYFDPKLQTSLLTDASSLNGLGFILLQHEEDGKVCLIQAGSRSMIDAEKRYAPIEQECLAAVWSLPLWMPHIQVSNGTGTFKKYLIELENRRLQRLREKVIDYNFTVQWVEGKTHYMADTLSRATMPCTEENMGISIAS